MRTTVSLFLLAAAVVAGVPAPAAAQRVARDPADRLADFGAAQDYAGGVAAARAEGRALARNARARAWYALLLTRDDQARAGLALADSLMTRDRRSAWSWFARTAALSYGFSDSAALALEASAEMYRRAPRHPDVVWLRAATLMNNDRETTAVAVVDTFLARHPASARHLVLRANALHNLAGPPRPDPVRRDSALALWARARALDSLEVSAWHSPGTRLINEGRFDEGLALLRRALQLAPHSPNVNRDYWRALRTANARTLDRVRPDIVAGIDRLLSQRGADPTVLQLVWREYETLGMPNEQRHLEERILRDHPGSQAAEWVLVARYRAVNARMRDTTVHDSTLASTYRAMLQAFLARPVFVNDRLRGDAFRSLFQLADSTTHPDTLLALILGMERYEGINPHITYARGAIALADRRVHLDQAERLAREGLSAGRRRVDEGRSFYDGVGEYARALDGMTSTMVDALAWVYARAGRTEDAERELRRAVELQPQNLSAFHHLGRIFEERGALDSADAYYTRGAMVATPQANPNRDALRALYRTRRGSLDGYDDYYAGLRDRDRARRRRAVESELRATRDPLPAFELATMDGGRLHSDSLRGRVSVVNFWGKWCGPCVAEMPELQRLWRQVAADSGVRLLTINNDQNLAEVREWMQRHRYDMPVLVDSGYASRNSMHTYPTTWFVDRDGRIAFVKVGWSEELVEEFLWRVRMLTAPAAVP